MVDLSRIRSAASPQAPTDPRRIFDRLPKPEGVNDLWKSQDEVLRLWQERRADRDVVIKLNTGGGKTLVGLLIAQAVVNERGRGALYLCANNQLVDQTMAKAKEFELPATRYESGAGRPLPSAFENGDATLVATYRSLFNGFSKFNPRGRGTPVSAGVVVCDDAHTAFTDIRDAFSIVITRRRNEDLYRAITSQFRAAAEAVNRLGSYDQRVGGQELGVFEVPYWAWRDLAGSVRDLVLKHAKGSEYEFQLPLVSDAFAASHVLVRSTDVTITPFLPPVDQLPTFSECPHRVFMSATIADDSSLVRTFDVGPDAVRSPVAPASLAGVGERMILAPSLTPVGVQDELRVTKELCARVAARGLGVAVLTPSELLAQRWSKVGTVVMGDDVAVAVDSLTDRLGGDNGPYVFVNRYDGVDLPRDACRLLVLDGMPRGASAYDEFRANTLRGSSQIELSLAQRVEQGIGRGTRGAGDHCVVVLLGTAADWVTRRANVALMTPATRAQLELGIDVSKAVTDVDDFEATINLCLDRQSDWVRLHARELAERSEAATDDRSHVTRAVENALVERKYAARYLAGQYDAAREIAERAARAHSEDRLFRGWLLQLAARAAFFDRPEQFAGTPSDLQAEAAAANTSLPSPPGRIVSAPLPPVGAQAARVVAVLDGFAHRTAYLAAAERAMLLLTGTVPAKQFEEGIRAVGEYIGLSSERLDRGDGVGPDNIWRTADGRVFVISCKNEKRTDNPLYKKDLSQLLIDAKWIEEHHAELKQIWVVTHASAAAMEGLPVANIYALTTDTLSALLAAVRTMTRELATADLSSAEAEQRAAALLHAHSLTPDAFVPRYLRQFTVVPPAPAGGRTPGSA